MVRRHRSLFSLPFAEYGLTSTSGSILAPCNPACHPPNPPTLISTLHGILKPFLLRRLKADVEGLLPPKKEYVIYAPLSVKQRDLYDEIVEGRIRRFLIEKGSRIRWRGRRRWWM
jgi:SNF2 family DNA or RNA helicase